MTTRRSNWASLVKALRRLVENPYSDPISIALNGWRRDRAQQVAHCYAKRMGIKITTIVEESSLYIARLR